MPTQPSAPRGGFKVTDLTVNIPSSLLNTSASTSERRPAPSRWGTLEFKIYYLVFMVVVPIMIWIPVSLSSPFHPNFPFYQSKLEHGWILGRSVDNSDAQYRTFRNNFPILGVTILFHLLSKYIVSSSLSPSRARRFNTPSSLSQDHFDPLHQLFASQKFERFEMECSHDLDLQCFNAFW